MRAWRAAQAFTSGNCAQTGQVGVQIVGSSTVTPRPTSRVIGAVGSGSLVRANPMYLPANYHNVRTVVFTAVRLQPQPFIVTPPHRGSHFLPVLALAVAASMTGFAQAVT